jgi:hypothetical protein
LSILAVIIIVAATAVPIVNRIARMCWFSCRFVMEKGGVT